VSQRRRARKIRSEEPAPGRILAGATPRAVAMVSTRPAQDGGWGRAEQPREMVMERGEHAGRGREPRVEDIGVDDGVRARRDRTKSSPMAVKKAPP